MNIPMPENEQERLNALQGYQIMDTTSEQLFDDIALLASFICDTPIALITLLDETRQWFKSTVGLNVSETPREDAFCSYAIVQPEMLIVRDALKDKRFAKNPLVTDDPKIRFYAGSQLVTPAGFALGTLCVIDRKPRALSSEQLTALEALSRQVITQLELRRISKNLHQSNKTKEELITKLEETISQVKTLEGIIPICSSCKNIRDDEGFWQQVEVYIGKHSDAGFTHGVCPDCMNELYPWYKQKAKKEKDIKRGLQANK